MDATYPIEHATDLHWVVSQMVSRLNSRGVHRLIVCYSHSGESHLGIAYFFVHPKSSPKVQYYLGILIQPLFLTGLMTPYVFIELAHSTLNVQVPMPNINTWKSLHVLTYGGWIKLGALFPEESRRISAKGGPYRWAPDSRDYPVELDNLPIEWQNHFKKTPLLSNSELVSVSSAEVDFLRGVYKSLFETSKTIGITKDAYQLEYSKFLVNLQQEKMDAIALKYPTTTLEHEQGVAAKVVPESKKRGRPPNSTKSTFLSSLITSIDDHNTGSNGRKLIKLNTGVASQQVMSDQQDRNDRNQRIFQAEMDRCVKEARDKGDRDEAIRFAQRDGARLARLLEPEMRLVHEEIQQGVFQIEPYGLNPIPQLTMGVEASTLHPEEMLQDTNISTLLLNAAENVKLLQCGTGSGSGSGFPDAGLPAPQDDFRLQISQIFQEHEEGLDVQPEEEVVILPSQDTTLSLTMEEIQSPVHVDTTLVVITEDIISPPKSQNDGPVVVHRYSQGKLRKLAQKRKEMKQHSQEKESKTYKVCQQMQEMIKNMTKEMRQEMEHLRSDTQKELATIRSIHQEQSNVEKASILPRDMIMKYIEPPIEITKSDSRRGYVSSSRRIPHVEEVPKHHETRLHSKVTLKVANIRRSARLSRKDSV